MNSNEIMVSISCIVYNQEKYIRKMLDSLLMQKTNFAYEIVIHDDASTDDTANIIREYESKYPDIFKAIYQTENQYSKGISISSTFNFPRCRGKYIAFCEGDDYWTDPLKLQKQVNLLEDSEECSLCLHRVQVVSETEEILKDSFPRYKEIKQGVIQKDEFLSLVVYTRTLLQLQFQINGCMARTEYMKEYASENPRFKQIWDVGDIPLLLYMGTKGNAYYINETMSCYRSGALGSWNSQNKNIEKKRKHIEIECRALEEFDQYSKYVVHESIIKGINSRKFSLLREEHDIKTMKRKEWKSFYQMLSKKEKIKEYILKYIPSFMKVWGRISYIKRNKTRS